MRRSFSRRAVACVWRIAAVAAWEDGSEKGRAGEGEGEGERLVRERMWLKL